MRIPTTAPTSSSLVTVMQVDIWWWKCVRKVSEWGKMTVLWHNFVQQVDTIMTHLCKLTLFGYIFWTFLTLLWHIFENDILLTVFWHIIDTFLTDLDNWQFSDRFMTYKWHILKSHGTSKIHEYQKVSGTAAAAEAAGIDESAASLKTPV